MMHDEFSIKSNIHFRFLCPEDVPELKILCSEWFPVDYPDSWFTDITSCSRFYSLAAIYQTRIIGILVAEVKLKKVTDRDDYVLLSRKHHENTQITYILSLGVFKDYRRLGIGII
jgi:ribosomal protein S18 acetylase RimI-like enzyme